MTGVWIALAIVALLLAALVIDRRSRAGRASSGGAGQRVPPRDSTDAVARDENLRTRHAVNHDGGQWGTSTN